MNKNPACWSSSRERIMKENSCCKEKEIFPCLYYPVLSWQEILSMASVRKRELLCGAPEEIEKLKEMSICAPKKNPETEFAVGRETAINFQCSTAVNCRQETRFLTFWITDATFKS